jgi:hypothetical protein
MADASLMMEHASAII